MSIFSPHTSLNAVGVLKGATDWHCHLLPGVDDGIKTLEDTLRALEAYEKAGFSTVWFTPHIMDDMPNDPAYLKDVFLQVKESYKGPIEMNLAAENMLDATFAKRFADKNLLTIGKSGEHILVETSYFTPPVDLYSTIQEILSSGLFPVLAHPERYIYMDFKDYDKLKEMNVLFQLNIFSLLGAYSKGSYKKARKLLRKGYYNIFGTDTHRNSQFEHFVNLKNLKKSDTKLIPTGEL